MAKSRSHKEEEEINRSSIIPSATDVVVPSATSAATTGGTGFAAGESKATEAPGGKPTSQPSITGTIKKFKTIKKFFTGGA